MTTLEIINLNKNLIYKIANNFYNVDKEDLYQVGVVGILKAYNNYKENGTCKFSTYAYDYIFGEMYNLANNRDYKVSKDLIRLYKKLEVARYTLANEINKIPNNKELSAYLNIELSLVESAVNITNTVSFDEDRDDSRSLKETVYIEDNISVDDRIDLQSSLDILDNDERRVIDYRYFKDYSQAQTAKALKLSQATVSRCEKRSIKKMQAFNNVA